MPDYIAANNCDKGFSVPALCRQWGTGAPAGPRSHNPIQTSLLSNGLLVGSVKHTNMGRSPQTEIFTVSTAGICKFVSA